jgi:hypothetical protein
VGLCASFVILYSTGTTMLLPSRLWEEFDKTMCVMLLARENCSVKIAFCYTSLYIQLSRRESHHLVCLNKLVCRPLTCPSDICLPFCLSVPEDLPWDPGHKQPGSWELPVPKITLKEDSLHGIILNQALFT